MRVHWPVGLRGLLHPDGDVRDAELAVPRTDSATPSPVAGVHA